MDRVDDDAILAPVAPKAGTGQREGYATALAQLWSGLSRTLAQLDAVAERPDADGLMSLPALQYRLHVAAELLAGTPPPNGAEAAHEELLGALRDARDLTGDVVDRGAGPALVPQWRVALFRVRLARSQLLTPPAPDAAEVVAAEDDVELEPPALVAPILALTCALLGSVGVVVGALLGPWPLWVAGLALVGASPLVLRR
jgi:hypothetical protein